MHARLADRVSTWTTLNEPWVLGVPRLRKRRARPGVTDAAAAFRAAHHLLLAHGLAAQNLTGTLALTLNMAPVVTPAQIVDAGIALLRRRTPRPSRWWTPC